MTISFFKTCETSVFEAPKKNRWVVLPPFFSMFNRTCTDTTCWPAKVTSQWYYGRPTVTRLEAYGNPLDCSGIVNMMLVAFEKRISCFMFSLKRGRCANIQNLLLHSILYLTLFKHMYIFMHMTCTYKQCIWCWNTEDDFARRESHYWWAPWRP